MVVVVVAVVVSRVTFLHTFTISHCSSKQVLLLLLDEEDEEEDEDEDEDEEEEDDEEDEDEDEEEEEELGELSNILKSRSEGLHF